MGSSISGGYFTGFRNSPAPALYGESRSAVTQDVLEVSIIVAFACVFVSILFALPSISDKKKLLKKLGQAFVLLYITLCLLLSILGFGWRTGSVHTETQYRHFMNETIHAEVGIKIGLYGFNITLKGTPVQQVSETIDYNEHVDFGFTEGRLEFGEQGGSVRQSFRRAQLRGTPLPILWVWEYLTLDGELIRWNRQFREAGYYTSIALWTAFVMWLITVALIKVNVYHASMFSILAGFFHITGCIVYETMHYKVGPRFAIPFEDGVLRVNYNWGFYLTLVNGVVLSLVSLWVYVQMVFRRHLFTSTDCATEALLTASHALTILPMHPKEAENGTVQVTMQANRQSQQLDNDESWKQRSVWSSIILPKYCRSSSVGELVSEDETKGDCVSSTTSFTEVTESISLTCAVPKLICSPAVDSSETADPCLDKAPELEHGLLNRSCFGVQSLEAVYTDC